MDDRPDDTHEERDERGRIVGDRAIEPVATPFVATGTGFSAGYSADDDVRHRAHFETDPERPADLTYERVRPAYRTGHLAARHPPYAGRSFDEVERDLAAGWSGEVHARHGEWSAMRRYARAAYENAPSGVERVDVNAARTGVDDVHRAAPYADPLPRADASTGTLHDSSAIEAGHDTA